MPKGVNAKSKITSSSIKSNSSSNMIRKQRLLTSIDTGIYLNQWIRAVLGVECFCVSKFKTQIVTWTNCSLI